MTSLYVAVLGTGGYGGTYYGSIYEPVDLGSCGGAGSSGTPGGRGGGRMKLVIGGILYLDGNLLADGGGGADGSGGGSGGSVWVIAGTLTYTHTHSSGNCDDGKLNYPNSCK